MQDEQSSAHDTSSTQSVTPPSPSRKTSRPAPDTTMAPLVSATDPRAEARANASATRMIMETREALLQQQIAALQSELLAVQDTKEAVIMLDEVLTSAINRATNAALEA